MAKKAFVKWLAMRTREIVDAFPAAFRHNFPPASATQPASVHKLFFFSKTAYSPALFVRILLLFNWHIAFLIIHG